MPEPLWRKVVHELEVPTQGQHWTVALEYVTPGKTIKIEVITTASAPGKWKPDGFDTECTADGDFDETARGKGAARRPGVIIASAPVGALVARIGGSTADQTVETGATANRIGFAVGRMCVFVAPTSPTGALFLGINDEPVRMARATGTLRVNIYEAA
jgi:hypothetical protein